MAPGGTGSDDGASDRHQLLPTAVAPSSSSSATGGSNSTSAMTKYAALVVLVVQNASLALTMRYSRASGPAGVPTYLASTAVVMSELFKLVAACALVVREEGGWAQAQRRLYHEIVMRWGEMAKLLVPAILYTLQNNLAYVAVSNLDAASYQVLYQLKILTTALFSVLLLKRALTRQQWAALCLFVIGVSLVQLSSSSKRSAASTSQQQPNKNNAALGLICVLLACLSSGFAGVWFEKVLKAGGASSQTTTANTSSTGSTAAVATPPSQVPPSIWVRNVQLALIGLLFSLLGVYGSPADAAKVARAGFFQGYRPVVWCVVLLQALGGMVVAVVVKYADNLLKGFATSISIVLSCLLSLLLFDDFTLSLQFLAGTATVIASTLAYSAQPGALSLRSLLSYIPAGSPLRGALQEFQKRQERAYHRGSDDGVHIMDTEGGEEQGSVV